MMDLRQEIFNLSVVDMHNHLDDDPGTKSIVAKDFWDIGEYFWVRRHLWSAGYPKDADKLPFDERARVYLKALNRAENTLWVRALKKGVKDLYDIVLKDLDSVYKLNDLIMERAKNPLYGEEIAKKTRLKYFVVNGNGDKDFGNLSDMAIHVEAVDSKITEWIEMLLGGQEAEHEIKKHMTDLRKKGYKGIRASIGRMNGFTYRDEIIKSDMTYDDALIAVLHYLSKACEDNRMFIQVFLGVAMDVSDIPGPFNDGEGVAKLYGLFEKYDNCRFTLITSSQAQNIDVINAANVFSNVQADGLWWYNLRPSSYKEAFEMRLEELPSIRSSIVATDAYVIEWCYIKMNLIKETLYEFMKKEIEEGHIDHNMAIKVASDWLSGTALELLF